MHISLFKEMQLDSVVSQRPIETETRSAAHRPALPAFEYTVHVHVHARSRPIARLPPSHDATC
jgi:hypothetical protein